MIALSSRYDHVGPVVVANQRQEQLCIHPSLLCVDIPNTFKLVSIGNLVALAGLFSIQFSLHFGCHFYKGETIHAGAICTIERNV